MTQSQKTTLPSGLPKQFLDDQLGYKRLQEFLEILNVNAVRAVLGAVKEARPRGLGKRQGAEWRREALTAYYGNPDSRRELWRLTLAGDAPATSSGQPVPSLEFMALQRHDPEFHEGEVDTASVEEALRDLPDAVESVAKVPDWQRPALAAWPALLRDIAEWNDLSDERRETALLAVFAVATVLDDLRLLQRAARGVDMLADEFAMLLSDQRDGSPTEGEAPRTAGEDVIRRWQETCEATAAVARMLGADPLQPELLPERLSELSQHVRILADLCEPVTEALDRTAPEKLLQRAHDIVAAQAQGIDSPISPWTDDIAAQWRSAYPPAADFDVESLHADVERLEAELPDALTAWRTARHGRADVERRRDEARQRAEHEDDPLNRLSAEDQEAELQQQLGRAVEEIRTARDRVFRVVAPADQVFDPHRHRAGEETSADDDTEIEEGDDVQTNEAETDAETTDTDESAAGDPEPRTDPPPSDGTPVPPEPPLADRREPSAVDGLWRTLRILPEIRLLSLRVPAILAA